MIPDIFHHPYLISGSFALGAGLTWLVLHRRLQKTAIPVTPVASPKAGTAGTAAASDSALTDREAFLDALRREHEHGARTGEPLSVLVLSPDDPLDAESLAAVRDEILAILRRPGERVTAWDDQGFAALLPDVEEESARRLAARLCRTIGLKNLPGPAERPAATVSAGVAGFGVEAAKTGLEAANAGPDEGLARAETAMLTARFEGGGRARLWAADEKAQPFVQLTWRAAGESGHGVIDEEHKELFRIANSLLSSLVREAPAEECLGWMDALLRDIEDHFAHEEEILREKRYPGADEHARRHALLLERARDLRERYRRDELDVGPVFTFLAYDVIARHMMTEDRKFFSWV